MQHLRVGIVQSLAGAVGLGALSAFGDWVWARYIPDGAIVPAIVHGSIVFLALAGVLAGCAGTRRAARVLLPVLPAAGMLLAAVFYSLARLLGYLAALVLSWIAMWLITAGLQRLARGGVESAGATVLRGAAAALASGLAFWAISGMWTSPSPDGPNVLWHFACWTFAFLPGFLAMLLGQPDADSVA